MLRRYSNTIKTQVCMPAVAPLCLAYQVLIAGAKLALLFTKHRTTARYTLPTMYACRADSLSLSLSGASCGRTILI